MFRHERKARMNIDTFKSQRLTVSLPSPSPAFLFHSSFYYIPPPAPPPTCSASACLTASLFLSRSFDLLAPSASLPLAGDLLFLPRSLSRSSRCLSTSCTLCPFVKPPHLAAVTAGESAVLQLFHPLCCVHPLLVSATLTTLNSGEPTDCRCSSQK